MAHLAFTKKTFVLTVLFLILSTGVIAQHTTMVFKYESGHQRLNLNTFLERLPHIDFKNNCLFSIGSFRFKLSPEGKIDTLEVSGDLPDTVVGAIRTRIKETEKYWVPVHADNGFELKKWIVVPVIIDRQMYPQCIEDKHVGEYSQLLLSLFDREQSIIVTPTSYLILPIRFFGIY